MTDVDLAAIRQRAEQATPGPWRILHDTNIFADVANYGKRLVANSGGHSSNVHDANTENERNAEFIAHARTDTPALLAHLALLEAHQTAQTWQPIETAPTNTALLAFVPNADYYGPGIYRAMLADLGTGQHWVTTGRHVARDLSPLERPTHWMPLPPAPSPKEPHP